MKNTSKIITEEKETKFSKFFRTTLKTEEKVCKVEVDRSKLMQDDVPESSAINRLTQKEFKDVAPSLMISSAARHREQQKAEENEKISLRV